MARTRRSARRELLSRLLDGYERSRAFGRPGPWARDVIVRVDEATFPEGFAADGREELAALRGAAEEIAAAGGARLLRASTFGDAVPRELRLGPDELGRAYALAGEDGYLPLADALARTAAQAARLVGAAAPWMAPFLDAVARSAAAGDLSPLGMQVERFKRDWRDLVQALEAAARISRGPEAWAGAWERVVSESIFADSKRLGELRALVADLLARADPRWRGLGAEPQDVLEHYGVRRKPGLIVCAGRAELRIAGRVYALEDFAPVAHLPEAWAGAWVDGLARAGTARLTTVENEYPFLAHVEERGGAAALGADGEIVVFTGGFPAPALVRALADLCRALPDLEARHFGDADLGGLRIWRYLRAELDRVVSLFRVDRPWLDAAVARRAGTPLKPSERAGLERLRRDLDRGTLSFAPDVRQALALIDGLLAHGMKVEQERA